MNILISICARGGSKGIPGKNIKLLNGKPLIEYTINIAHKFSKSNAKAIIELSTDSEEIKAEAKKLNLITEYLRPKELGNDNASKIDVISHLLDYSELKYNLCFDYILDLDVTSPLRNLVDLESGFQTLMNNPEALNLFSVSPASRSPYFNMVEQKENGFYNLIKSRNEVFHTRQGVPQAFDLNASFYFYRRSFFTKKHRSAITEKSMIYNVPHMCFDLDHMIDFEFLNYLLANNKLDFNL